MLPRTTPEQRKRFYEDVEQFLFPGFLTHPVIISGVRFQLRSLGPGDLFMLRARGEGSSDYEWRVWILASSIWMVNGNSVLGVDQATPFLANYLRRLPAGALASLFSLSLGLFARVKKAAEAVQSYCYEASSRYQWATNGKGHGLRSPGVPGAETLGMNVVQQIWLAYNMLEDIRVQEEQRWEGFKLVASSNAPKALKKVDSKDGQRRKQEQDRRQRQLDLYFYQQLGLVDDKGMVRGTDSSHRFETDKSVEVLEEEMRRWVTEDHDLHDAIVAEYKQQIRVRHEAEKAERLARQKYLREQRAQVGWDDQGFRPEPLVAMTAQQLQAMLADRPASRRGVTFIPKAPNADRLYEAHVGDGIAPGNLAVVDGKVVDPTADPQADERTLNELVRGRHPVFGAGE